MFKKQDILDNFYIPLDLERDKDKNNISDGLKTDLELDSKNNPYKILFEGKRENNDDVVVSGITSELWKRAYSTNPKFIKKMQLFIKKHNYDNTLYNKNFINEWLEFKNETSFLKKYEYFDWKHLNFLNENESMLQVSNCLNITSPVLSLLVPIILFIIPLIIIFYNKEKCNISNYSCYLKKQLQNHAFGKFISIFSTNLTTTQKLTSAMAVAIFVFTTYQNILMCIKIYSNVKFIQSFLYKTKTHISHTMDILRNILDLTTSLKLSRYNIYIKEQYDKMNCLYNEFDIIQGYNLKWNTITKIGKYMKLFYKLYNDEGYYKIIMFGFGVNGFTENICNLKHLIKDEKIKACRFDKKKKYEMIDAYYLYLIDEPHNIKNNIYLDKNHIIHGPNASGKTTLLKTTLLNILFSQQFGYGCYSSCNIPCYDKIYSYINIPDTSSRDSLFQSEARRCLDIINDVKKYEKIEDTVNSDNTGENTETGTTHKEKESLKKNKKKHNYIALFDELYSGTNPKEAVLSATGYLKYLEKHNISFLLTSHFDELKDVVLQQNGKENDNKLKNILSKTKSYYMDCIKDDETKHFKYSYSLKEGSININGGGLYVLEKLNYPFEIIDFVKSFV